MRENTTARTVISIVILVIIVVGLFYSCQAHNDWKESCERRGGHVVSHMNLMDRTGTTYYCLNGDGGIIDVR